MDLSQGAISYIGRFLAAPLVLNSPEFFNGKFSNFNDVPPVPLVLLDQDFLSQSF